MLAVFDERRLLMIEAKKPLTILLASQRGFCAGVERAIQIVERTIARHGRPVYVRHEIVHNRSVVEALEAKGAVFVEELDEVPDDRPVVFSAHGVPKAVPAEAIGRNLLYLDATCPLVSKVHREMRARTVAGDTIVYVGHRGHDETEGAIAHASGPVHVVGQVDDILGLDLDRGSTVSVLAQTTVAVSDWDAVVDRVRDVAGSTWTPPRDDICFATTNRQRGAAELAAVCDAVVVVGSPTSANTAALAATARAAGCAHVLRVASAGELGALPRGCSSVGVIAGASTPAQTVREVVHALEPSSVRTLAVVDEQHHFPLAAGVRRQIEAARTAGRLHPRLEAAYLDDRNLSPDALLDLVESVVFADPVGAR